MNIVEKYLTSYDVTFFVMKKKDKYIAVRMKNGLVVDGRLMEMDKRTTLGEYDTAEEASECLRKAMTEYKMRLIRE